MPETLGELDIDIKIDFNKVNRTLSKISSRVGKISKRMSSGIRSALGSIVSVARNVTGKVIGIFTSAFRRVVKTVRNAMLISGAAIAGLLAISIKAATVQEDALFALQTALKLTGDDTVAAMKDYQAFASAMQKTTVIGDEQTLMLLAQHKQLGVNTKDLKKAAEMTIGLSAATGRSQDTITRYVAEALQGEFNSLRRIIPELKGVSDKTKAMTILTKFAANGMKIAEGRILTTTGALTQMKNAVGDVTEVIGAPFLASIVKSSKALQKFAEDNQKQIGEWAQTISDAVDKVKEKIVAFFSDEGNQEKLKKAFNNIVKVIKPIGVWLAKITKQVFEFTQSETFLVDMKDAWVKIKDVVNDVREAIKKAAGIIKDWVKEGDKVNDTKKTFKDLAESLKSVITILKAIGTVVGVVVKGFSFLNNVISGTVGLFNKTAGSFTKALLVIIEFGVALAVTKAIIAKIVAALLTLTSMLGAWILGAELAVKGIAALAQFFAGLGVIILAVGAAFAGWELGKWAVKNFAWVDSISTSLANLFLWLGKVINLIPGVNLGGIGTFDFAGGKKNSAFDKTNERLAAIKSGTVVSKNPVGGVVPPPPPPPNVSLSRPGKKEITPGEKQIVKALGELITATNNLPDKEDLLVNNYST